MRVKTRVILAISRGLEAIYMFIYSVLESPLPTFILGMIAGYVLRGLVR